MGGVCRNLLGALVAVLALAGVTAGEAAGLDGGPVVRKVGILAHRGDEAALRRWRPTMDAVEQAMPGLSLAIVPLSLDGAEVALSRGEIDYIFTNPGHFQRLAEQARLAPMASLRTDREGKPVTGNRFGAVIFVRGDNAAIATLADLKNRKLAAVAPDAFGGFEIAAATLLRNGIDPWEQLGSIAFLGFPQRGVIDAVMSGAADAGTVRSGILEAAIMSGQLPADAVRVLNPLRVPGFDLAHSTELVPEWLIAAGPNVPERERRSFTVALLGMEETDPAALAGSYGGWTTVPADPGVRRILEAVDAAHARAVASPLVPAQAAVAGALAVLLGLGGALLFVRSQRPSARPGGATAGMADNVHLTPRETEILSLVADGMTSKEIARRLGISPKTVEFHRSHLMRKLKAHNMAELVRNAGAAMVLKPN